MIPIDRLRAVRRIIVHANCSDGRASAVILKAALPAAEVTEMTHGSAEHRALAPAPGVLFCDFVPWLPNEPVARASLLRAWVEAGAVVLDHHKGTEDIVRCFGERGVFADEKAEPGVSGAVLAFRDVLVPIKGPDPGYAPDGRYQAARFLARLVGIRDTWQRSSADWQLACEASEVFRFLPLENCLTSSLRSLVDMVYQLGPILWRKKLDAAAEAAKGAVQLAVGGRRVALISSVALTSDVADALPDVDVVAGFDYIQAPEGVRLQWSLRSRGGVDVSAIARRHGGNGHTAAAGFSVPVVRGREVVVPYGMISPYEAAEVLFGEACL